MPLTGRAAVLSAFDRLFDRAASKLNLDVSAEEKERAREDFIERYDKALQMVDQVALPEISEAVMADLEAAIDQLSPAAVAGHLATVPLAVHVQDSMRRIAAQLAEQRLLEHLASQADDKYGGN
jgi:hypothetical protein